MTADESSPWPAVDWEERCLPPLGEREQVASIRYRRLREQPYQAAIVPAIAQAALRLDTSLMADIADAETALSRFDEHTSQWPVPFAAVLLRSESSSSSQIEHLTAGARAIAEAAIDERDQGNARLIVRNVRALEAALALADRVDAQAIIEMQHALLGSSAPELTGRFRSMQVWIGHALPQEAMFVPPHPDRVAAAMDDLVAFLRRDDVPRLAQIAIAHAQFETIHPFPDGNGRTGRALVAAMLRHGGLLRNVTVPISAGLLGDIGGYFDALSAYRLGSVEPIIRAFVTATYAGLANGARLADDLESIRSAAIERLAGVRADAAARRLVDLFIAQPVVNQRVVVDRLRVSAPTAYHALDQLVERSIITATTSRKRNRLWVADSVIDALNAFADRAKRREAAAY